ncbi:MAG: 50S ribosomal protein L9 [Candidatus Cloacimonadaceae bacterium]|nr:50S ribosomal protein L9 [Candidatus Cloacimonadota bacterium]MDY0127243.1 50S ribosomal protein L9 [Candidatus Cloacimonadaceae bacterium]MCB5254518.1 50S ribosomal protein L9 [Candidatus Cloacimonadota bacterium]MCK9178271.1 50S ribosomal protein L9 [Candidatus Cloacimonadota bacterium]MCK9242853.1 50S ribosomal protein L9 [Candidatus Cloacimonadota bacterium]
MKVIMLENIEKLGNKGEVVNVKKGYARNYLVPRALALYATPANMKKLGSIQAELKADEEKKLLELKNLAEKIASVKLTFIRKADEQGSMFGSVSDNDIVVALKEQDINIMRSNVQMEHHIKELGEHNLQIKLHKDVVANLNFVVEAEAEVEVEATEEVRAEVETEVEAE